MQQKDPFHIRLHSINAVQIGLNLRYSTFPAFTKTILSPIYVNVCVLTRDLPLADNVHALYDIISLCQLSQLFTNLFCHETLHVSESSSVHHQEFTHFTLSNGICHTGL
jgi:hypothetical protein